MFKEEEQQCINLASDYVMQTCKQVTDKDYVQFETEFCKHDMVRKYLSVLFFFANNKLTVDAEERYLRFYNQIETTQKELDAFKLIKLNKDVDELVGEADKELQQLIAPMAQIFENRISKDYKQLAKVVCTHQA